MPAHEAIVKQSSTSMASYSEAREASSPGRAFDKIQPHKNEDYFFIDFIIAFQEMHISTSTTYFRLTKQIARSSLVILFRGQWLFDWFVADYLFLQRNTIP